RGDDLFAHLVLDGEHVGRAPVEAIRPDMLAADGVDQLRIDADQVAARPDAALDDEVHSEVAPDVGEYRRLAFVAGDGVAGDQVETGEFGKVCDQVLGDAVGEVVLAGIG